MLTTRALATAHAAVTLTAGAAHAQWTISSPASGFVFNGGTQTFVDPDFDYSYSFRSRGYSPSASGFRLLGAEGQGTPAGTPCVVGETCQIGTNGAYTRGANGAYQFRLDFGDAGNAPRLTVFNVDAFGALVPGTTSVLTLPSTVGGVLNTFFLQVRGQNGGGSLSVSNIGFNGAVPNPTFATGLGNNAATPAYLQFSYAGDLTGAYLTGDISTQNLTGASQETPAFDFYVGAVSAVPEPSTYALMATGLVGILGLARRRTSQKA